MPGAITTPRNSPAITWCASSKEHSVKMERLLGVACRNTVTSALCKLKNSREFHCHYVTLPFSVTLPSPVFRYVQSVRLHGDSVTEFLVALTNFFDVPECLLLGHPASMHGNFESLPSQVYRVGHWGSMVAEFFCRVFFAVLPCVFGTREPLPLQ